MWNQIKTILLMGVLSAMLIAIGAAIGPSYMYIFAGLSLIMNLGAYFFSDRIVLAMNRAQELAPHEAPRLHRMVEELSQRAGIPRPRLFLMPEEQPNAFATGRNPEHGVVAVTQGLLDRLDEREVRGVIAHELGHIKNRDVLVSSLAAAAASMVTYAAHALGFATMFGGHSDDDEGSGAGGLLFVLVAPIAATLVQLGISRSREYLADETGAQISGDPEALASALEKLSISAHHIPASVQPATASLFIVNPFGGGGVLRLLSTHPPMEDRIERLRLMARGHAGPKSERDRLGGYTRQGFSSL